MLSKKRQVLDMWGAKERVIKSKLQSMAQSSCKDGNVFGSGKERGGKLETTKKMDVVLVATWSASQQDI